MDNGEDRLRRSGLDRRGWRPMPKIPFTDSDGNLVTSDRRKNPDRRRAELTGVPKRKRAVSDEQ